MSAFTKNRRRVLVSLLALLGVGPVIACHSYHIDATIENRTGAAISLMEVDYPSASFGADTLASNGVFHYSFQTRNSGQVSVQYTIDGHQVQVKGPTLYEGQQGRIEIVLLPGGKIDFHPLLQPQH